MPRRLSIRRRRREALAQTIDDSIFQCCLFRLDLLVLTWVYYVVFGGYFNHSGGDVVAVVILDLSLPPAVAYHAARSTAVMRKHLRLYRMQGSDPFFMAFKIVSLEMPSSSAARAGW